MDFLLDALDEIASEIFFSVAHLLNLDLDIVFVDTTSTYWEVEVADERDEPVGDDEGTSPTESGARAFGHSKDSCDGLPQVVIAMAVTREIAQHPRTDYVAQLVGANLYRGTSRGTTVELTTGGTLTTVTPCDGDVLVAFPPTAVSLHRTRPGGSARNTWPVQVRGLEGRGTTTRIELTGHPDVLVDVTPAAVIDLDLAAGTSLWAALKATEIRTYPA